MQALAREIKLAEATFILPCDAATEARRENKVRIVTVDEEFAFTGRPTFGTALYLYKSESNSKKPAEIMLECVRCHPHWRSQNALQFRQRHSNFTTTSVKISS